MGYGNVTAVTLTAAEALADRRRVKLDSSGNVVYADAADLGIGVTQRPAANAESVAVLADQIHAAVKVTAAGVIAKGAKVYAAADGKVSATAAGVFLGYALEAATADLHQIAVLFSPGADPTEIKIRHVVTAGEATADTLTVDSGLGVAITWAQVQIFTSAGVQRVGSGNTVTFGTGGSAGQITVASTAMAADDVVMIHAGYNPVVL